jgi:hypothetical protein
MTAPQPHLESEVCDVADMAAVCGLLVEHFNRQTAALKGMSLTGKQAAEGADRAAEPLIFAVHHLNVLARQMRKEYYAETEKVQA